MDALAGLRGLELTDEEVRAVLARRGERRVAKALVIAVPLAAAFAVALAVPPSRAELADALRAVLNGGPLPGEAVPRQELPDFLRQDDTRAHVIAEAGGERLLVFRAEGGDVCFDFGVHVGICGFDEDDFFADSPVALFGPTGPDAAGRFRIWGLALASVARVELRFADGPPVAVPVDSGFGLVVEAKREPTTLVVYDRHGRELTAVDVRERWAHRPAL